MCLDLMVNECLHPRPIDNYAALGDRGGSLGGGQQVAPLWIKARRLLAQERQPMALHRLGLFGPAALAEAIWPLPAWADLLGRHGS